MDRKEVPINSTMAMNVEPVVLEGRRVRLEPLSLGLHRPGLVQVMLDPELWRWTLATVETESDLDRYLATAMREQAEERSLPFVTVDMVSGRVAGSTRFGNIERSHRRAEIGWTTVGTEFQRSHINTEAKYLMLRHAFETWGCIRVELKTNALNLKSRNAMLRIGCKEEGTLRRHAISERGVVRDTVFFSILDHEWPSVKERLERMMER
ncbi:MAG: GNAT family N-acetyltransferase [Candidatus Eiseniibacteriota bacterium]